MDIAIRWRLFPYKDGSPFELKSILSSDKARIFWKINPLIFLKFSLTRKTSAKKKLSNISKLQFFTDFNKSIHLWFGNVVSDGVIYGWSAGGYEIGVEIKVFLGCVSWLLCCYNPGVSSCNLSLEWLYGQSTFYIQQNNFLCLFSKVFFGYNEMMIEVGT